MSLRTGWIAMLAAVFTWAAGHAAAAPIERNADLAFSTRGQSLFGASGGVTRTESVTFDVINQQHEQLRRGRIVNSQVPLSLATTQAIWQRAIDTCTSYSYTLTVGGVNIATFNPSETECINGEIRRNYCVVPPHLGWNNCPDPFGGNRQTYVRDLGPGIGARPTSGTSRPYDFGAIVTMSTDVRLGFEGMYSYDLGSVDIDYSARARLTVDNDSVQPGAEVTITTSAVAGTPYLMNSRYPSFELALDMYAYARMAVEAEYAGVDPSNGDPVRRTRTLYSIDTRDNPAAVNGIVPFSNGTGRLFGVRLDSSGLTRTLLGVSDHVESRYEYTLTWPFNSPETPGKKAPAFQMPLAFSLLEFAFSVPQLDTPVASGYLCGDCTPLRNFVDNGVLVNTAPVGARTLLGGITDGNGLKLPFVNDGVQHTDVVRLDVDLDAITVAAGVPLGAIVSDPLGILEAEVNLLDLDLATFISADQRLSFDPRLKLELQFSKEVELRSAGETDFTRATSRVVNVGETVIFRQPAGGVSITPVYTLRDNAFTNDTKLKISNAIQETLGQVKLGGYVGDGMGALLGDDANFALLQITPTLYDPTTIWNNDATPFSLGGFADHVDAAITVRDASTGGGGGGSGGGGSGGGGAGGGGSGSGSGSGGGGAWDFTSLGMLLLAAWLTWRLRYHPASCRRRATFAARC